VHHWALLAVLDGNNRETCMKEPQVPIFFSIHVLISNLPPKLAVDNILATLQEFQWPYKVRDTYSALSPIRADSVFFLRF
jgi:hypothetical protein